MQLQPVPMCVLGSVRVGACWVEKELAAISGPQVRIVERAFQAMWNDCLIEVLQRAEPLILLAAHAASGDFLVIVRTRNAGYGRVRPTIGTGHMCSLLGELMRHEASFVCLHTSGLHSLSEFLQAMMAPTAVLILSTGVLKMRNSCCV